MAAIGILTEYLCYVAIVLAGRCMVEHILLLLPTHELAPQRTPQHTNELNN
jgi:hypothetical protein